MSSDLVLAREAQLVYSNIEGWSPIGNSLRTWRGEISVGQFTKTSFVFEIFLPNLFPSVPPVVRSVTPLQHSNVDKDGFVHLRILENWRAEFHVYQVITSLTGLMTRAPPTAKAVSKHLKPAQVVEQAQRAPASLKTTQKDIYESEISNLQDRIRTKDEQLTKLKAHRAVEKPLSTSKDTMTVIGVSDNMLIQLEGEKVATSELLARLHDDYSSGDINIYDYSRLYKKYSQELYILQEKILYVKRSLAE